MNDVGLQVTETDRWISRFRERNGRAPTALHIGNIANAAYLNAHMLNEAGIDCDVLCYEYYHIMGCPEWEAAVFDPNGVDPDRPRWSQIDLNGYQRPRWFAQGSLATCLDYLIARRTQSPQRDQLWRRLEREQAHPELREEADARAERLNYPSADIDARICDLVAAFQNDFPLRPDRLSADELRQTLAFSGQYFARFRRLSSLYDIVIGYSTDGILPLAVGKRPFLAYEHGTIRALPFEDNTDGRLCALTYSRADLSFITNCDTVIAAEKLKLGDYRFVPHPINEHVVADPNPALLRSRLCQELQSDFLVFHPARQHWEPQRHPSWEKGNDIFLKGFAQFVKTARPGAAAILVDWGRTVAQSRALIAELGITDRVVWIRPQNAAGMAAYIQASDVLADQFFLGAWGSTMPRALYLGKPAMIYVNESIHRWCFPEMPPVVNVDTSDAVHHGLCRLVDENYRRELGIAGRAWYEKYHSNELITGCFAQAMRDVLAQTEERRLQVAVRELRDAAAICRQLQEKQAAAYSADQRTILSELHQSRVSFDALRDEQIASRDELRDEQIAKHDELCDQRIAHRTIQLALDAISGDLQEIKQQLRTTASTVDQIEPMIPNMLRAQRLARFVLGPPFWLARFLYRRARRGAVSSGASSTLSTAESRIKADRLHRTPAT
jgi:glycosyltransferase involved in cell wall biosynthesis